MRVDYILPAMQPGTLPELPAGVESTPSFRDQLRTPMAQLPISWEQQLRLDVRPFTGSYIGPPPRPPSLQMSDAETERSRWRSMVWRHCQSFEDHEFASSGGKQAIHTMLEMLLQMQDMEDSIVARQVAVTRG